MFAANGSLTGATIDMDISLGTSLERTCGGAIADGCTKDVYVRHVLKASGYTSRSNINTVDQSVWIVRVAGIYIDIDKTSQLI